MSVWGKVIGGVAGFALGGPLGAIMGTAAGHMVDRSREGGAGGVHVGGGGTMEERQVAFTTAVIVLAAKMAKADGHVTRDEVSAFKDIFRIPPDERVSVARLFDEAKQDAQGFEPYARQIGALFAGQPQVLEELLGALFHIAKADGTLHPTEMDYLARVAAIFGFSEADFARAKASFGAGSAGGAPGGSQAHTPGAEDSYGVLGLDPSANDADIKKTYRAMIRDYHPDKLTAHGLPKEFIELANEKMAAINGAYDAIKKERGL